MSDSTYIQPLLDEFTRQKQALYNANAYRIGMVLYKQTQTLPKPELFVIMPDTNMTSLTKTLEHILEVHNMDASIHIIKSGFVPTMLPIVKAFLHNIWAPSISSVSESLKDNEQCQKLSFRYKNPNLSAPDTAEDYITLLDGIIIYINTLYGMVKKHVNCEQRIQQKRVIRPYILYMNDRVSYVDNVHEDIWSYFSGAQIYMIKHHEAKDIIMSYMHGRMFSSWEAVQKKVDAISIFIEDVPTVVKRVISNDQAKGPLSSRRIVPQCARALDSSEDVMSQEPVIAYNVTVDKLLDERQDVKRFVLSQFNISERSEPEYRMRAHELAQKIEQAQGITLDESMAFRNRLSDYLIRDVGLKKKRDASGFYYYGIQSKQTPVFSRIEDFMAYREMELTKTSAPVDYHAANEYDTKVYGVMQEVIAQSSADGAEESAPSTNSSLKS